MKTLPSIPTVFEDNPELQTLFEEFGTTFATLSSSTQEALMRGMRYIHENRELFNQELGEDSWEEFTQRACV